MIKQHPFCLLNGSWRAGFLPSMPTAAAFVLRPSLPSSAATVTSLLTFLPLALTVDEDEQSE